jgi:hypothetical protein
MTRAVRIHLELYRHACRRVEIAHGLLFSTSDRKILSEFGQWSDSWAYAFGHRKALQLPPEDLVTTGRLLARVAESYTEHDMADRVFTCLRTLFEEGDPNRLEMAEMLVGAGEIDRRRGRPDRASERCMRALAIAEAYDTPSAHKLVSRIQYELAYVDLYSGDAVSALQRLALSRTEADKGGDAVGAGIARALSAAVLIEEGVLDDAAMTLHAEAMNFAALARSEEIVRINRHVFANRWHLNCKIHHTQALLASGEIMASRQAYNDCVNDPNPSALGNATLSLTGACIALAEGHLDEAALLAERCRDATPMPFEDQEAAATIASVYGVISLARGDVDRACDAFCEATRLKPGLRNARGQGWAALGLALLAIEAGDGISAVAALDAGITRCAQCCAPVRGALTELRAEIAAGLPRSGHDWKMVLRALTGPLPKWLVAG